MRSNRVLGFPSTRLTSTLMPVFGSSYSPTTRRLVNQTFDRGLGLGLRLGLGLGLGLSFDECDAGKVG